MSLAHVENKQRAAVVVIVARTDGNKRYLEPLNTAKRNLHTSTEQTSRAYSSADRQAGS